MILDLDVGNTRVKWRTSHATGGVISHGACLRDNTHWIEHLALKDIDRVRISNVAGQKIKQQLQRFYTEQIAITPEFASSRSQLIGVRNGYVEPERLGVDRWLAVLAAFNRSNSSCCVVDCGSAITIDYVSANGTHEGGVIAPGIELMRRALLADTQEIEIRSEDVDTDHSIPAAHTTEKAVELGLKYMEAGLVEIACNRYEKLFKEVPELFLTGGDAQIVSNLISQDHEVIPHLVLDGLALALP
ncbi:MAG: type III pantothenate kinase [Gammaproteobacteria bacterium]|nr:type III pantothenate kinase [Gammaproteobacteria bacterium]